jgi:hypothetical protein
LATTTRCCRATKIAAGIASSHASIKPYSLSAGIPSAAEKTLRRMPNIVKDVGGFVS